MKLENERNIMSRIMKNKKKREYKKLLKFKSLQETLIHILRSYYLRTEDDNHEVQKDMFPTMEPESCDCCGDPVYPILKFIHEYEYVCENYDSQEVEDILLGLVEGSQIQDESVTSVIN